MANNKVVFGEEVLIDLTQDTVTPYALEEGYTAHAPSGEKIVGVMKPNKPVEVETNAEMTTISTGATEKDLGKVYIFVGEDDGVFEKDALYILVKKGTGYGFQRYAIGGSGEAGEDLTAVLDEQSQLIAELKEKLANGGGGSQECDCVIDVTELPTGYKDVNLYVRVNEYNYASLLEMLQFEGLNPSITYYVVDELPATGNVTDFNGLSVVHVYIANNIPYAYGNLGDGNMWLPISALMAEIAGMPIPDKGFTSDITATTEAGVYVTYKDGEKPVEGAVYRMESISNPEVYFVDSVGEIFPVQQVVMGAVRTEVVHELPTSLQPSGDIYHFYVVENTGVAYASVEGNVYSFGEICTILGYNAIADKGWINDISSATEEGAYCTCRKSLSIHIFSGGMWQDYGDAQPFLDFIERPTSASLLAVPEGVTALNGLNFCYLSKCRQIIIAKTVKILGSEVITNVTNLETIVFKGMPTSIADNSFGDVSSISDIYVPWAEGMVANAPWGAPNATIHYNTDTSNM